MPARAAVKTPTLLQMEAVECGAAALGILLGYYGRFVPLAELRATCGVSRDGSNAAHLVSAARHYGLRAKGLSTDLEDLQQLDPPFIVFWNFNHFLVVEGFEGDSVRLNDPASGRRAVSAREFDEGFTGVVLQMDPGDDFRPGGRKPQVLPALLSRLDGCRTDLAYCLVAGLLLVVPGLALPTITRVFVDGVLIEANRDWLRPLLIGLAGIVLLQASLAALQMRYLRELRTRLAVRMSSGFLWHILRLPAGFFSQRFAGEISSRVALNGGIANALSGELAASMIDSLLLGFYLLVMLTYDVPLTLLGVACATIHVSALAWMRRTRVDANQRLRQETGKVASVAIAGLAGIESLKASSLESDFFARWSGHYTKAASARLELGLTQQKLAILPGLLTAVTIALVLSYGGWRVIDGQMSVGMLIAFQGLMWMFLRPLSTLVNLGSRLQTLEGDMLRVDDVLDHPVDPAVLEVGAPASEPSSPRLDGRLELEGVTFGYSRVRKPLIEGLDLVLEPGQRVALIGGSGSGKSTVARLVTGLYQPWEGEIRFDGVPRDEIPRERLALSVAMVDQDVQFFPGTVRDNLTLWDPTVPRDELEAACIDAEILDVVRALPGGFDAELIEGAANLSGGQRQRLEIARALVQQPSLLVMDEATSALDTETEARLDRRLRYRGCSMLVVSHRLSTIRDSDEIVVLRQGRVIERGTHEALWSAAGEYRRLVRRDGGT